jgi:hypothetical protein
MNGKTASMRDRMRYVPVAGIACPGGCLSTLCMKRMGQLHAQRSKWSKPSCVKPCEDEVAERKTPAQPGSKRDALFGISSAQAKRLGSLEREDPSRCMQGDCPRVFLLPTMFVIQPGRCF